MPGSYDQVPAPRFCLRDTNRLEPIVSPRPVHNVWRADSGRLSEKLGHPQPLVVDGCNKHNGQCPDQHFWRVTYNLSENPLTPARHPIIGGSLSKRNRVFG